MLKLSHGVIISALFLLPLIIQGSTSQKDSNYATYVNPWAEFKVQYNAEWIRREAPPDPQSSIPFLVAFLSPKENATDNFIENILITTHKLQNTSVQEFKNNAVSNLKNSSQSLTIISTDDIVISDKPAFRIFFNENFEGINLKKMQILIPSTSDELVYIITFGALEETFDNYLADIDRMIKTFSIDETLTQMSTFRDAENNIMIKYPSHWKVNENITGDKIKVEDANIDEIVEFLSIHNQSISFTIGIHEPVEFLPFDDYSNIQVRYINNTSDIMETGTIEIAGQDAFEIQYTVGNNNLLQIWMDNGEKYYHFVFEAPKQDYANYSQLILEIIRSISL